jgi:hypothetical protein
MVIGWSSARDAEYRALAGGELGECLLAEAADRLSAAAACLDDAGGPQPTDVPRHERLRQADVGDELGDRRFALGESPDDAQSIDVGHDLVERTQLAQVLGLGNGGGDRTANAGG